MQSIHMDHTFTRRAHDVMVATLLRRGDVVTSFRRSCGVIFASCVRWLHPPPGNTGTVKCTFLRVSIVYFISSLSVRYRPGLCRNLRVLLTWSPSWLAGILGLASGWLAQQPVSREPGSGIRENRFGFQQVLFWVIRAQGPWKKMYLRNYILHRGGAVCIFVIGFRWYSTERSGFDWFDHWSFDCDCMRRLWNYGMKNYLIFGSSLFLCWSTGDRSLRCTLLHPCVLWSWGTDINDFNYEYLCVCMCICRWKCHSVYSCCLA